MTPNALAPPARVASPLSRASSADSTRSADVLVSSGPLGLGSQAIAAAASQAIAATQQMQQGRRSASLKASYEAIAVQNLAAREFTLGSRDIASLTPTAGGAPAAAGAVAVSGTGSGSHSIQTPNTPASGTSSGVSLSSSISALLEAPLATPTSRKSNKKWVKFAYFQKLLKCGYIGKVKFYDYYRMPQHVIFVLAGMMVCFEIRKDYSIEVT